MPGANAATMALVLSGLPPLPVSVPGICAAPRQAARRAGFARLRAAERAGLSATLVFYEAPHRLAETLADMAQDFGDRPAAVARELTKRFEEVRRGTLAELAAHYATPCAAGRDYPGGRTGTRGAASSDLDALLLAALRTQSVREAAGGVAEATGLPRGQVYARALALKARRVSATSPRPRMTGYVSGSVWKGVGRVLGQHGPGGRRHDAAGGNTGSRARCASRPVDRPVVRLGVVQA